MFDLMCFNRIFANCDDYANSKRKEAVLNFVIFDEIFSIKTKNETVGVQSANRLVT